jgi:hypothetical protein
VIVFANVNVVGLRAGQRYELDDDHPGLAQALAAGFVEDVSPRPAGRRRPPERPPAAGATPAEPETSSA